MADVNDKELLAICNLTNLKLEFANLDNTPAGSTNKINHTIYSLLYDEKESILSDKKSAGEKKPRVFFDLENDKNPKKPTISLYTQLDTFKSTAGIVYEYFEKYAVYGNKEGAFTKEWKIMYAADSYKLITDFIDHFIGTSVNKEKLGVCYVDNETGDKKMLYKVENQLKMYSDGKIYDVANNDPQMDTYVAEIAKANINGVKLYPSRAELKAKEKEEAHVQFISSAINFIGLALPASSALTITKTILPKFTFALISNYAHFTFPSLQFIYDKATQKKDISIQHIIPLSLKEKDFGVVILTKGNNIVISFRNGNPESKIWDKIKREEISNYLIMMKILYMYLFIMLGITTKDKTITITGFNTGADLGNMLLFSVVPFKYGNEEYWLQNISYRGFRTKDLNLVTNMKYVSEDDIFYIFSEGNKKLLDAIKDSFTITNADNVITYLGCLIPAFTLEMVVAVAVCKILLLKKNFDLNFWTNKIYELLIKYKILIPLNGMKGKCKVADNFVELLQQHIDLFDSAGFAGKSFSLFDHKTYENAKAIRVPLFEYISHVIDTQFIMSKNTFTQVTNGFKGATTKHEIIENFTPFPGSHVFDIISGTATAVGTKNGTESYYEITNDTTGYHLKKHIRNIYYIVKEETDTITGVKVYTPLVKTDKPAEYHPANPSGNVLIMFLESYRSIAKKIDIISNSYLYINFITQGYKFAPQIKFTNTVNGYINSKVSDMKDLKEFIFFPYINNKGELKTTMGDKDNSQRITYAQLNDNYIGSLLRSVIEDYLLPKMNRDPKFYTPDEAYTYKEDRAVKNKETYLEKELISVDENGKNQPALSLVSGTNSYIRDQIIDMMDYAFLPHVYMNPELGNNMHLYHANNDFLSKIKEKKEIVDKFFYIKDKPGNGGSIKILYVGIAVSGADDSQIAYIYDEKDYIKRGIVKIECTIPDPSKDPADNDADSKQITSGDKVTCTNAEGLQSAFIATHSKRYAMNGKKIGISSDNEIISFGKCDVGANYKCTPKLIGGWSKMNTRIVDKERGLTNQSTILCKRYNIFGKISFVQNDDASSMSNVPKDENSVIVEETEPSVEDAKNKEDTDKGTNTEKDSTEPKESETGKESESPVEDQKNSDESKENTNTSGDSTTSKTKEPNESEKSAGDDPVPDTSDSLPSESE